MLDVFSSNLTIVSKIFACDLVACDVILNHSSSWDSNAQKQNSEAVGIVFELESLQKHGKARERTTIEIQLEKGHDSNVPDLTQNWARQPSRTPEMSWEG